jgi:hypothetical protein
VPLSYLLQSLKSGSRQTDWLNLSNLLYLLSGAAMPAAQISPVLPLQLRELRGQITAIAGSLLPLDVVTKLLVVVAIKRNLTDFAFY